MIKLDIIAKGLNIFIFNDILWKNMKMKAMFPLILLLIAYIVYVIAEGFNFYLTIMAIFTAVSILFNYQEEDDDTAKRGL